MRDENDSPWGERLYPFFTQTLCSQEMMTSYTIHQFGGRGSPTF